MQLEGKKREGGRERDLREPGPGQSGVGVQQSCGLMCYLGLAGALTAADSGPQLAPPGTWSGGAAAA